MQFDDFLGQVQHRAHLASKEDALRATRATLETLAQRLQGEEPRHLGAQLPREIAQFLAHERSGAGEHFDSDEFLRRVCEREGGDLPAAVFHARAVLDVLQDAVSPGEMDDVIGQLPKDYRRLFEAGSKGRMGPA